MSGGERTFLPWSLETRETPYLMHACAVCRFTCGGSRCQHIQAAGSRLLFGDQLAPLLEMLTDDFAWTLVPIDGP